MLKYWVIVIVLIVGIGLVWKVTNKNSEEIMTEPTHTSSTSERQQLKFSSPGTVFLGPGFSMRLNGAETDGEKIFATIAIDNDLETPVGINTSFIRISGERVMAQPRSGGQEVGLEPHTDAVVELGYPKLPGESVRIYYVHETTRQGYDLGVIYY